MEDNRGPLLLGYCRTISKQTCPPSPGHGQRRSKYWCAAGDGGEVMPEKHGRMRGDEVHIIIFSVGGRGL